MQKGFDPVDVLAFFKFTGAVIPLAFWWGSQRCGVRVLEVLQGETLKARGVGTRYKIVSGGQEAYLYRIVDTWFIAFQDEAMKMPDTHTRFGSGCAIPQNTTDARYNNPCKAQVEAEALCKGQEYVEPVLFIWEDGRRFSVEKTLRVGKGHSAKAGIVGIRYDIVVRGQPARLYRDNDLWFMERSGVEGKVLDVHGRAISSD